MGQVLLVRHGQASFGRRRLRRALRRPAGSRPGRSAAGWPPAGLVADAVLTRRDASARARPRRRWREVAGWSMSSRRGRPGLERVRPPRRGGGVRRRTRHRRPGVVPGCVRRGAAPLDRRGAGRLPRVVPRLREAGRRGADPGLCRRGTVGHRRRLVLGGPVAAACAALLEPDRPTAERGRLWTRLNTVIVNGSCSRVLVGSTGPRLLTFNEHEHLSDALRTYR